jgi:hypothetical protein
VCEVLFDGVPEYKEDFRPPPSMTISVDSKSSPEYVYFPNHFCYVAQSMFIHGVLVEYSSSPRSPPAGADAIYFPSLADVASPLALATPTNERKFGASPSPTASSSSASSASSSKKAAVGTATPVHSLTSQGSITTLTSNPATAATPLDRKVSPSTALASSSKQSK